MPIRPRPPCAKRHSHHRAPCIAAFAFGGARYPVLETTFNGLEVMDISAKDGGHQVEYQDENPAVLDLSEKELAVRGPASKMRQFVRPGA